MKMNAPSKLYKYRSGTKNDLESLTDCYVWSASIDTLNDPCEGITDMRDDRVLPWLADFEISFLRRGGVCSFGLSPLDPRCWAYYAASHSGYCVEYDVETLITALNPKEFLLIEVQYMEAPPVFDFWTSLGTIVLSDREEARYRVAQAVVGTKDKGWQHEGEWRLITSRPGRVDHPPNAVTGLYFGSKMDARTRARISRKVGRRGFPLSQVTASKVSYELHANRVLGQG